MMRRRIGMNGIPTPERNLKLIEEYTRRAEQGLPLFEDGPADVFELKRRIHAARQQRCRLERKHAGEGHGLRQEGGS